MTDSLWQTWCATSPEGAVWRTRKKGDLKNVNNPAFDPNRKTNRLEVGIAPIETESDAE